MAAGDITYGTQTALASITRLHSNADGVAEAFGEIAGGGEIANNVEFVIPINASATAGTYDIYLVTSQDGAVWTDDIDPATSGDIVDKISDAKLIWSASTIYDASDRTEISVSFNVSMLSNAEYIGFVLLNDSGQTIPASGASGNSVSYKVS